ncbi:MAG: sulfite exporter TauE/SafE family protein [Oscillospiraceae bacterium]
MSIFIAAIAALLAGITASLGLGGGMILIIYLTVFAKMGQVAAQGINLLFFIPIAALSLIIHSKNHLVEWKKILPSILIGLVGAIIGTYLAGLLNPEILQKAFAVFILIVGIKELFSKTIPPQKN